MTDNLKLVSGGDDIKIWELPELRLVHTIRPHSNAVSSLAWSPNSILFVLNTTDWKVIIITLILFKFISNFQSLNGRNYSSLYCFEKLL